MRWDGFTSFSLVPSSTTNGTAVRAWAMIFMCCQSADPSVWVGIGLTPSTALPDAPAAPDPDPEPLIEPEPPLICPIALGAAGLVAAAARAVVESVRDDVPHADSRIPASASSAATASVNRGARVRQIHRRREVHHRFERS